MPKPKCQMKDEIDFKIDRIPPFGIFHLVFDIHGRSNFGKKSNPEIYIRLPWVGMPLTINGGDENSFLNALPAMKEAAIEAVSQSITSRGKSGTAIKRGKSGTGKIGDSHKNISFS